MTNSISYASTTSATSTAYRWSLRAVLALTLVVTTVFAGVRFERVAAADPAGASAADTRVQAKANYDEGKRQYAAGNYQAAIDAFGKAEQLMPSGYNDFNIALAYDKLGDATNAVAHYRSYLTRIPDAANKAAVEGSISRLDAASASAASKTDAAQKAEAARQAADAANADAVRRVEEAARDRAAASAAAPTAPAAVAPIPAAAPPMAAAPSASGDADLDAVASLNVSQYRDQHTVAMAPIASSGPALAAPGGPSGPAAQGYPQAQPNGQFAQAPVNQEPAEKPLYKQWWFWVVIGVSAVVLISIAGSNNSNTTNAASFSARVNRADDPFNLASGPSLFHF